MKIKKVALALLGVVIIVGCVSSMRVPMTGQTLANKKLQSDTDAMIKLLTSAKGCDKIDKIDSMVLEKPTGNPGHMTWKEQWTVYGCAQSHIYMVTFKEDGMGGAYFSIIDNRKKDKSSEKDKK